MRACVRTVQANAVKVELVQHFAYEVLLVRSHRGVDRAHKLVRDGGQRKVAVGARAATHAARARANRTRRLDQEDWRAYELAHLQGSVAVLLLHRGQLVVRPARRERVR